MSDLDVIKEIEEIIGKKLKPCHPDKNIMTLEGKCSYILNNRKIISLNLMECNISNIIFLAKLKSVCQLNLAINQIVNIKVLNELPNLIHVILWRNKIIDTSGIDKLRKLTYLDLRENNIKRLAGLKNLFNLNYLYLDHNEITNISSLSDLNKLILLSLYNNNISDISPLKKLNNLTSLDLRKNNICDVSHLDKLEKIKTLYLNNNKISDIKPIKEILCNINTFSVGHNPIINPPPEIISRGIKEIYSYFKQIDKVGLDYIYESKLILVGEGGAGKTSLANKIINPQWQLIPENESQSTQGIEILKYEFPYKDKTFRVNIWDFGGQEIYHQTHQFFLSKRSLYLLLADNRKEDSDFYYWLNTVGMLSDNSPLLIIKNEKSDRKRQISESQLKADFNNIKDIFATNLSNNRGLTAIIENLQHYLGQLPHIGSPLPKTWVKVREQLEHDDRYYLDLKEYFAICQANGFESEADKRQLSGYLHDLGVCLHFQEHELLDKTLILKPTWATDAVYKVLDNADVIKHSGRFSKDDLKQIWQAEQYSDMRSELLALMQKFKLCYEIPNRKSHYISPQLLEDKAPIMTENPLRTASHGQDLLLRYQYDFMPKGIVSQFIVVMHEYIAHNYEWVWKSGVILEKDKTQAEIIEYYGKREIYIRVVGQNKKELLNIVSYELDKINSSYERLKDKCKKLIPCLCKTCESLENPHFYDYEKLKERIAHRKYTIECGNPPYADVDILKLIDGLDLPGFKNLEGLGTKQTNFYINTGDKTMSGDTNYGVYVGGNVTGGNIAGHDMTINNQGMNKDEFAQLLAQLKQELAETNIEPKRLNSVTSDIAVIENEIAENNPDKDLIENKISGINLLLEKTNKVMDSADKGKETLMRVIATGKTLLSALSFLA